MVHIIVLPLELLVMPEGSVGAFCHFDLASLKMFEGEFLIERSVVKS